MTLFRHLKFNREHIFSAHQRNKYRIVSSRWSTNTITLMHCHFLEFEIYSIIDDLPFLLILSLLTGCCIYKKQLDFGESSSEESEDECDHCFGHVEIKKKKHFKKNGSDDGNDNGGNDDPSSNENGGNHAKC